MGFEVPGGLGLKFWSLGLGFGVKVQCLEFRDEGVGFAFVAVGVREVAVDCARWPSMDAKLGGTKVLSCSRPLLMSGLVR